MTRFPYRFRAGADGAPSTTFGVPVVYSPYLATTDGSVQMVLRSAEHGRPDLILTNDPDFAWNFYRAECRVEASRIVRDGLRRALPWLNLDSPEGRA